MNSRNGKRLLAMMMCALLLWTTGPVFAEEIRGAALLTWDEEGTQAALYLNGTEYDWNTDPEGKLVLILPEELVYTRHGEQEEPCAVMRLRLGAQDCYVESVGEPQDYARAGQQLLSAAGEAVEEEAGLPETLEALCGRRPVLSERVTEEDWRGLRDLVWGAEPETEAEADEAEPVGLTMGHLYAELLTLTEDEDVREALAGYRAEFEDRGEVPVNWAFLLCVLSETVSPSGEGYPYLVFGGQEIRRLILRGEVPEYTVKLYVDDECIDRLTVKEGEDVSLPNLSGVTWVSDGQNIQADRILCGYTTKRVTFCLNNAGEFADRLKDLPVEWVQNVLYGHRVRPSVHYMEMLAESGLSVQWSAEADERVHEDKRIEGMLVPMQTESPAPTQTPEPTQTPVPESCTVTFVFPAELGYAGEQARVSVQTPFGGTATPPVADEAHQKEHYTLTWPSGWEKVTSDLVIEGVLTPKTYVVRCRVLDGTGAEYAVQEHAHVYGTALTLPAFELPAGQKIEWDALPEQITGDCELVGRLVEIRIVVTYRLVALDGSVSELGSETIAYGGNATLPLIEIPDGCEVTWSGALSGLTEDTVVTGTLTRRQYTVSIQVFDVDGNVYYSSTQQVAHGGAATAPAFTVPDGCTFAWDAGTSFDNVTADRVVTGRLTRLAPASTEEAPQVKE